MKLLLPAALAVLLSPLPAAAQEDDPAARLKQEFRRKMQELEKRQKEERQQMEKGFREQMEKFRVERKEAPPERQERKGNDRPRADRTPGRDLDDLFRKLEGLRGEMDRLRRELGRLRNEVEPRLKKMIPKEPPVPEDFHGPRMFRKFFHQEGPFQDRMPEELRKFLKKLPKDGPRALQELPRQLRELFEHLPKPPPDRPQQFRFRKMGPGGERGRSEGPGKFRFEFRRMGPDGEWEQFEFPPGPPSPESRRAPRRDRRDF